MKTRTKYLYKYFFLLAMFSEAFYPEVKTPAHQHKGQHSDMYINLNYTTQFVRKLDCLNHLVITNFTALIGNYIIYFTKIFNINISILKQINQSFNMFTELVWTIFFLIFFFYNNYRNLFTLQIYLNINLFMSNMCTSQNFIEITC